MGIIVMRILAIEFTNGHRFRLCFERPADAARQIRDWWMSGLIYSDTERHLQWLVASKSAGNSEGSGCETTIVTDGPWCSLSADGQPILDESMKP